MKFRFDDKEMLCTVSVISCEVLLHKFNLFSPPYGSSCAQIISIY